MKLSITFGLFLAVFLLSAQTAKMNRDIEVAEKILETLIEEKIEEQAFTFFGNQRVSGSYIADFGVLFTIAGNSLTNPIILTKGKKARLKSDKGVFYFDRTDGDNLPEEDPKDKEKSKADFKNIVETFFFDYAYLLRALAPNDKIMIQYGGNGLKFGGNFPILTHKQRNYQKYSATISKSAINQYKENKQKLIEQIAYRFDESSATEDKDVELSLLSTVLKKLYQGSKEGELYIGGSPNYERIEGLGAIYHLSIRLGSHHRLFGLAHHNSRTIWEDGNLVIIRADEEKEQKEKSEKAKINLDQYYDQFIADLKNSIVDYGSIVKSLKNGEQLIFKLNFPNCDDCTKMPKRLEITAKKATLTAYRKDSISLEKAVSELVVK